MYATCNVKVSTEKIAAVMLQLAEFGDAIHHYSHFGSGNGAGEIGLG